MKVRHQQGREEPKNSTDLLVQFHSLQNQSRSISMEIKEKTKELRSYSEYTMIFKVKQGCCWKGGCDHGGASQGTLRGRNNKSTNIAWDRWKRTRHSQKENAEKEAKHKELQWKGKDTVEKGHRSPEMEKETRR